MLLLLLLLLVLVPLLLVLLICQITNHQSPIPNHRLN